MSFSFNTPEGFYKEFQMPAVPTVPDVYQFDHDYGTYIPSRSPKLGLRIQDTEESNGVLIMDVEENSAAEKAGVKEDDIITEIGGQKITNTDEARKALKENKEKNSYNIKAKRKGNEMSFDIKIPKKLKTTNL
jgi:serine protease Do